MSSSSSSDAEVRGYEVKTSKRGGLRITRTGTKPRRVKKTMSKVSERASEPIATVASVPEAETPRSSGVVSVVERPGVSYKTIGILAGGLVVSVVVYWFFFTGRQTPQPTPGPQGPARKKRDSPTPASSSSYRYLTKDPERRITLNS